MISALVLGNSTVRTNGRPLGLSHSFGLNSTSLNGPVPIGCWRISRGDTWHGYTSEYPEARREIAFAAAPICGHDRGLQLVGHGTAIRSAASGGEREAVSTQGR